MRQHALHTAGAQLQLKKGLVSELCRHSLSKWPLPGPQKNMFFGLSSKYWSMFYVPFRVQAHLTRRNQVIGGREAATFAWTSKVPNIMASSQNTKCTVSYLGYFRGLYCKTKAVLSIMLGTFEIQAFLSRAQRGAPGALALCGQPRGQGGVP